MERDYSVNRKIKEFIEETDKKPSAVADKAGIRRDTFSRIINKKRVVYADEILPICSALGVSVGYLFGETVQVNATAKGRYSEDLAFGEGMAFMTRERESSENLRTTGG